ncbi:hypothetical protein [uncultured Deefgea sp.]|uniref:hypothetical protein n=1 Tax=uncultured Deefgea sp. TaxID=1304914 RepID=UPI0025958D9B|nr:hypothetical protein [uncultured Deefgea sp.]
MNKKAMKCSELSILAANLPDVASRPQEEQQLILEAAGEQIKILRSIIKGGEQKKNNANSAIVELAIDATAEEFKSARIRQAVRRGADVYLPSWSAMSQALPSSFLRTALFSCATNVTSENERVLAGDSTLLVANKVIASFSSVSLVLSGNELCQFDRQVYAACLDYYRDFPLATSDCKQYQETNFYEFSRRMGNQYSKNLHKSIQASLLRLRSVELRIKYKRANLEALKLMTVYFEDDSEGGDFKASDRISICITNEIAELFGVGDWTAVEMPVVKLKGLAAWVAHFYASHSESRELSIETLYKLSGYQSKFSNFKASLKQVLEKLADESIPAHTRVSSYVFSEDDKKITVKLSPWKK